MVFAFLSSFIFLPILLTGKALENILRPIKNGKVQDWDALWVVFNYCRTTGLHYSHGDDDFRAKVWLPHYLFFCFLSIIFLLLFLPSPFCWLNIIYTQRNVPMFAKIDLISTIHPVVLAEGHVPFDRDKLFHHMVCPLSFPSLLPFIS